MTSEVLEEVARHAQDALSRLVFGPAELVRATLQPTSDDYAAVFVDGVAPRAEAAYADFWRRPPAALTRSANPEIRVVARRAQDLVASGEFPGGYAHIAALLAPDPIWCRFKLVGHGGQDVIAYDGLVARGERWAWFPKPWRVLRAEIAS